ncbi:MAG: HtaA domain-containing protein [Canibacter sp.]
MDLGFGEGNGVNFNAHGGALDVTLTNPRVSFSGESATLSFDTENSEEVTQSGLELATVDLSAGPERTPGNGEVTLTWTSAPVTFTGNASSVFNNYNDEPADPLTLTVTVPSSVEDDSNSDEDNAGDGDNGDGQGPGEEENSGNEDPTDDDQVPDEGDNGDEEVVWEPKIEAYLADGVTPLGTTPVYPNDEIVVKGSGFDPTANVGGRGVPIPSGQPQGVYVVFGNFQDTWKPSEGAASSNRVVGDQKWLLTSETVEAVLPRFQETVKEQWAENTEGAFELSLTASEIIKDGEPATGNYGVYTYAAGGADPNEDQELMVPLSFENENGALTPAPEEEDTCIVATGATLNWGVKESFRKYVRGPIAQGEISWFGGVKSAPEYTWSGGAGSVEDDDVELKWTGGVHFKGHEGQLDMTISNPTVKFGNDAGLFADVKTRPFTGTDPGDLQPFETYTQEKIGEIKPSINQSESGLTATSSVVLTDIGSKLFGLYDSGEPLDAITVNSSVATANCADGVPAPERGTGSEKTGNSATDLPVVAANQPQEEADVCVAREVTGGDLSWGVKDRFRSYVTGKIAKGSVSESGFGGASGAVNVAENGIGSAQFGGSTHFTGHKGILDMTLSNPKVQLFGNGSGVLYLDVQANDRAGNPSVSASGVAFANLSGATPAISGDSVSVSGASATLTSAGASAFGGFYSAGEALDSVSFNVSLGGEVPCGDDTNPATLAETGSDLQPMLLAGAAFIALMGMALMRASRRRAQQVR